MTITTAILIQWVLITPKGVHSGHQSNNPDFKDGRSIVPVLDTWMSIVKVLETSNSISSMKITVCFYTRLRGSKRDVFDRYACMFVHFFPHNF